MAGKGGGAWKVAYADFVTAMMAFFLVMWIVAQDQKIKEAIAHYFVDPMGYVPIGQSNSPSKTGGLFDSRSHGRIPDSRSIAMGRGRFAHSDEGAEGVATKLISDWLHADPAVYETWHTTALQLQQAEKAGDLGEETAAEKLSHLLRDDYYARVPLAENGVYRELLLEQLSTVSWDELAEDLLTE
jgi:flagellar motor protein MotB